MLFWGESCWLSAHSVSNFSSSLAPFPLYLPTPLSARTTYSPGAVKLDLWRHWMHATQVHPVTAGNQFHCTRVYLLFICPLGQPSILGNFFFCFWLGHNLSHTLPHYQQANFKIRSFDKDCRGLFQSFFVCWCWGTIWNNVTDGGILPLRWVSRLRPIIRRERPPPKKKKLFVPLKNHQARESETNFCCFSCVCNCWNLIDHDIWSISVTQFRSTIFCLFVCCSTFDWTSVSRLLSRHSRQQPRPLRHHIDQQS